MPAHRFPEKVLERVRDIIENCLKEGYSPPDLMSKGKAAHTEAVRRIVEEFGCKEDTAWHWVARTSKHDKFKPDYTLFRPYTYQAATKAGIFNREAAKPDGSGKRIGWIGDCHDAPQIPKDRFYWMGCWVREADLDEVIQVGDFATLDSLTRHAAPGTQTFADLPSYKEDLDSLHEALQEFERGLEGYVVKKTITWGNHEQRAVFYEDRNPQLRGLIVNQLKMIFEQYGWRVIDFGEIYFSEGVGTVHHPVNSLGKALGGKTADQRAGNDVTFTLLHGHDHRRSLAPSPKLGPLGYVDVISVGCSLPHGLVEDYAKHGPSGWWWGVTEALVNGGQILSMNFTSMLELEDQYSEVA